MIPKLNLLKDPQIKIVIILVITLFISFYCVQKWILKPYREKIAEIKKKLEHIELENQINTLRRLVCACEKSLPPQKETTWLLTEITNLAQQAGINLASVQPLGTKNIPPYSYTSYKVKTTCTNTQLLEFIQFTENSEYFILLEQLTVIAPKDYKLEFTEKEFSEKRPIIIYAEITIGTAY